MSIKWHTVSHPDLEFDTYIPAGFPGIRVPGSTILSSSGNFGQLCLQAYKHRDYSIQYSVLNLAEPFIFQGKGSEKGVYARIVLENHIDHKIKGAGDLYIREGQFSMISALAPEAKIIFREPQQYSSFDAFFSIRFLKRVLQNLPEIQRFFGKLLFRHTQILVEPPRPANKETHQLIDTLLHVPDDETRMTKLLTQLLEQLEDRRKVKRIPTRDELEKIYEAERIVAEDIRKHYLIPELARKVETNDFTIKNGFHYAFGLGPYGFLTRKRMRLARRLLQQKVSIKTVALETGYRTTAEFSFAFKQYYKVKPSDYYL